MWLHTAQEVLSLQYRELSCNQVWGGPILTEPKAWASFIHTWGMQLILVFFSTEGLVSAMWFSKLSSLARAVPVPCAISCLTQNQQMLDTNSFTGEHQGNHWFSA